MLSGCASQMPDSERLTQLGIQRATEKNYEAYRLREVYRKAFTYGFLRIWDAHGTLVIDPGGDTASMVGESPDPQGEIASREGYRDGQLAAQLAYKKKQAEK